MGLMLNSVKGKYNRTRRRESFKEIQRLSSQGWGEWEEVDWKKESRQKGLKVPQHLIKVWKNNIFVIQYFHIPNEELGIIEKLFVRRKDESTKVSWADKQRIKNELISPDALMVECYPPEKYLVDDANIYWLWILPDGNYPFLHK